MGSMAYQRPNCDRVSLLLYRGAVHPELIEPVATREVGDVRAFGFALVVHITPSGHALSWRSGDTTLTEMTVATGQLIQDRGKVWRHRFRGQKRDAYRIAPGLAYQMCSQIEQLSPQALAQTHDELVAEGQRTGLMHLFMHATDGPAPLGLVTADIGPGRLAIYSYHTFPNELAILRTQSLIERRS